MLFMVNTITTGPTAEEDIMNAFESVASQGQARALHVVLGAGQVGQLLGELLKERGHRVRMIRRSAVPGERDGIEWVRGDATDRDFMDEALRGAAVVYNCANPPDYARWDGVIQPLFTSIRQATARAGARLVTLDNLYAYGRPDACPFDEDTPMRPCSQKGEIRRQLAEDILAAHTRGDLDAVIGRASDFFGPGVVGSTIFRPDAMANLIQGKPVDVMGDPDLPRAYSYTPDVARGLAVLGEHAAAAGRVWHLPLASTTTTRELLGRFAAEAGVPLKVRALPTWALKALGLVSPLMKAVGEMAYQWEVPYVPSDRRFVETFGMAATDVDEAVRVTLASSRGAFARSA